MTTEEKLRNTIREIPDFPKPGIRFKDITPLLSDPGLCREIIVELARPFEHDKMEAVVGVESRGFLFGMLLSQHFNIPFVPVRKAGKLPYRTVSYRYELEYGSATIEMHEDAIRPGWKILVHDDLLATGGTAAAAAELILKQQAHVAGFSFLIELGYLSGRKLLERYSPKVLNIAGYYSE